MDVMLLLVLTIQLVLRSAKSDIPGMGLGSCNCDGALGKFGRSLSVNGQGHGNCRILCRIFKTIQAAKRDCSTGKCVEVAPPAKVKAVTPKRCKDASGNSYAKGQVWRESCRIYTCEADLKITDKTVRCPQTCFLTNSIGNRCCPICKRKLTCTQKEMKMEIPLPLLRGTDASGLSLSDGACRASVNSTHVVFKTGLTSCKTRFKRTKDGFVYSNYVLRATKSALIIRPWFKFSCLFRNDRLKVRSALLPFKVNDRVEKEQSDLAMFYTNENGSKNRDDGAKPVVRSGQPVYVAVVASNISRVLQFLALEQCSLTLSDGNKSRDLIVKGCPVGRDMKIHQNNYDRIWFSFKASKLGPFNNDTVDLNCQGTICWRKSNSDICNRQCSSENHV